MPHAPIDIAALPAPWPELLEALGFAQAPAKLATRTKLFVAGVLRGLPAARLAAQVTTLAPLVHLPGLAEIDLCKAPVDDLAPLVELLQLRRLCMWQTRVHDLRPLRSLRRLAALHLWGTRISDLAPLRELPLEELSIEYTNVESLEPLSEMRTLRTLALAGTKVTSLAPLAELELEELQVQRTAIGEAALVAFAEAHPRCRIESGDDYPPFEVRCPWTWLWSLEHASDVDSALLTAMTPDDHELETARLEVIRALLQRGANPNVRDPAGRTPLWLAASKDRLETVELLIARGGDPRIRDHAGNLPYTGANRAEVKAVLQRHGGGPVRPVPTTSTTPLRAGGRARHPVFGEVAILSLHGHGPAATVNVRTSAGEQLSIRASFLAAVDEAPRRPPGR